MTNTGIVRAEERRVNFGKIKLSGVDPDLLEIQLQSFQEFFQLETTPENRGNEGLFRVFQENFPITDARNIFVLEFLDYFVDPPRYTIPECMQRGLTYSVPSVENSLSSPFQYPSSSSSPRSRSPPSYSPPSFDRASEEGATSAPAPTAPIFLCLPWRRPPLRLISKHEFYHFTLFSFAFGQLQRRREGEREGERRQTLTCKWRPPCRPVGLWLLVS